MAVILLVEGPMVLLSDGKPSSGVIGSSFDISIESGPIMFYCTAMLN